MLSCFPGLSILPFLMGFVLATCFTVTYAVAVAKSDVSALFPYISDTGAEPPQSCIFTLCLNIASFIGIIIIYIRYRIVIDYSRDYDGVRTLNFRSLFLGYIAMFGMMVVGAFQDTAVLTVHLIGAGMVFGCGCIYAIIHCVISRRMGVAGNILLVRQVCAILSACALVSCVSAAAFAYFEGDRPSGSGTAIWDQGTKGFTAHVVSTFSEWIMGTAFLMFFMTFHREFKPLTLDVLVKSIEGPHHAELKPDSTYEDESYRRPLINH